MSTSDHLEGYLNETKSPLATQINSIRVAFFVYCQLKTVNPELSPTPQPITTNHPIMVTVEQYFTGVINFVFMVNIQYDFSPSHHNHFLPLPFQLIGILNTLLGSILTHQYVHIESFVGN